MSRIFSPTLKLATISSYAGTDKILSTSKTLKLNTQRIRHYLWCDADTSKNSRNKIKVIKTRNSAQIQENQRKPKKTKESQRKPKKTKANQRKPKKAKENQRKPKKNKANQRKPKKAKAKPTKAKANQRKL